MTKLAAALHLASVALSLAVVLPFTISGLPADSDFTAFYTGFSVVRGGGRFYDVETQRQAQRVVTDGEIFLPYLNPPHATVPFIPLAWLSLKHSSQVWTILQLILVAYALALLRKLTGHWDEWERLVLLTGFAGSRFLLESLYMGAFSLLVTVALLKWYLATRDGRDTGAGCWLAVASVKPQTCALPLAGVAGAGRFRQVLGCAAALVSLTLAAVPLLGWSAPFDYLTFLSVVEARGTEFNVVVGRMINLRALLDLVGIGHSPGVLAAAFVAGALFTFWLWRRSLPLPLLAAFTIPLGLFLSPHANPQDGLALYLPGALLYERLRGRGRQAFAYFAVGLPLLLIVSRAAGITAALRLPLLIVVGVVGWSAFYLWRERRLESRRGTAGVRRVERFFNGRAPARAVDQDGNGGDDGRDDHVLKCLDAPLVAQEVLDPAHRFAPFRSHVFSCWPGW